MIPNDSFFKSNCHNVIANFKRSLTKWFYIHFLTKEDMVISKEKFRRSSMCAYACRHVCIFDLNFLLKLQIEKKNAIISLFVYIYIPNDIYIRARSGQVFIYIANCIKFCIYFYLFYYFDYYLCVLNLLFCFCCC